MNEASICQFITQTFADVQIVAQDGSTYFFRGEERNFPFATLVTNDDHDTFSNLTRPDVYRLNIGVSKETFPDLVPDVEARHDFTALNQILPHPVYGKMYWVCILSPTANTFERQVRPLLTAAYERAAGKPS